MSAVPAGRVGAILTNPWLILGSIGLGAYAGVTRPELAPVLAPYGQMYLALLKMCVLPLMMAALVSSLGRMLAGGCTERYLYRLLPTFLFGMLVAAAVGMALAQLLAPGAHLSDEARLSMGRELIRLELDGAADGPAAPRGLVQFLGDLIPANVFEAASSGSVLPVVVFCVLAGLALGSLRNERGEVALRVVEGWYDAMLKLIGWVMYGLPAGLVCLVADQISRTGTAVLAALAGLVALFYLAALLMLVLYTLLIWWRVGGTPLGVLQALKQPLLVALGTSSSFAAMPATLRGVREGLGRQAEGANLTVPLGVSLNPQGNVLHFAIAAVFVAQLYGQSPGLDQMVLIMGLSVLAALASGGAPGIAALGVLALVLEPLGLPVAVAIILLTAIDPLVDPVITAVNVHANCAASAWLVPPADETGFTPPVRCAASGPPVLPG